MGYETTRKSQAVRKTPSTSHRHVAFRQNLPYRCTKVKGFLEFGSALVSGLSEERPSRDSELCQVGTAVTVDRLSERKAEEKVAERSCSFRTHHRPMDVETHCAANPCRLRCPIYACGGMEAITPRFRLELSKTATTRLATKRKGHCVLETQDMAQYKKKPENLRPTLLSWTKAGFCSYRMSVKPGLLRAAHRSFATATSVIRSRPSEVSPYPLAATVLVFMSVSMRITSPDGKSSLSCGICCVICADMLFLSGTAAPSTRGRMLRLSCKRPSDFISTGFPVMLRNSIRLNMFGLMGNAIFLTARMKTRIIWDLIYIALLAECVLLRSSLNHALHIPRSLGHE